MNTFEIQRILRKNIKKLNPYQAKDLNCKIKLDANELPFSVKLSDIITDTNFSLNRYPDPEAILLRKAISKKIKIPYTNIMVGNGSDELIYYLILTFGGPVLYPVPTFVMYGIIAQSVGVERIECKLDRNFDLNCDVIINKIKKLKPHLIFLSSPNNPTGNCFSTDKILKIFDIAEKYSSLVVMDEAYQPFCSKKGFISFLKDYKNLIILRTLSKIGFAGLRIGYLIGNEKLLQEISKVKLPYNVDALTQSIATETLNKFYPNIVKFTKEVIKQREYLYKNLSTIKGIQVFPSEANFILFRVKNSKKVFKNLFKKGILIRDLSSLIKNSLRVTVGTKEENNQFLNALREILEE